jgi:hypothetical protein
MATRSFYRNLKPIESFQLATDTGMHDNLPLDWFVVLTDVIGSTVAIERGRYKDVNTIGAATIMGIVNVDRSTEIPFVFGGDGATLAIPPHMAFGAREALLASQKMAQDVFNLNLRIAIIPVADIANQKLTTKVGKYRQSRHITQTTLSGSGWTWAENILKDSNHAHRYLVVQQNSETPTADFSGLECRWEPVDATNDFKFCIIIKCLATDQAKQDKSYQETLEDIEKIAGIASKHHPLSAEKLRLSLNPIKLYYGIRALDRNIMQSVGQSCMLVVKSIIGRYAIKHNIQLKGVKWGNYRDEMIENADYRKFDGTLKMVLDLSENQTNMITSMLETRRKLGQLIYGTNKSKKAIMTCLVFSNQQNHAHFVDGSDGGYALAAKMLKSQMLNNDQNMAPLS